MLCYIGQVSLYCFLGAAAPFLVSLMCNYHRFQFYGSFYLLPIIYFLLINAIVGLVYKKNTYKIAVRSVNLGFLLALGVYIRLVAPDHIQIFGLYMCTMSIFHYSEFLCMANIQPKLVSADSFVINHSVQYTIAALTSWVEFFVEAYFFPDLKTKFWLSHIGLVVCIIGELLRKAAMLTASSNFNHLVQCEKVEGHILVTHGVYSIFRHPSYVGWFYWSIGTQVILLNPLCIIAYTIASWTFFRERILIEEIMLLNFFGQQYCDYQEKVRTGLPFIDGYKI
ncbi:hypothetical protein PPYR_08988 [Photinus pyralis]|uniref:Protein-S-isoprenylcysteine O-methyltransferase n=1 Tax=Photinus pyralis TaxID=7054 RepID=A0A5N4AKW4_PHOPY|nr:protein-S-isoprenylcysteine O-methyltransferase [Photinus pyralis]KAB0797995.1 hypothetical protein PPYR_08988 [Photinus pyralis]